jgi:hypothetical protein
MSTDRIARKDADRLALLAPLGDLAADGLVTELVRRVAERTSISKDERRTLLPHVLAEIARDIKDEALDGKLREFLCAGGEIDETIRTNLDHIKRAQNFFDSNGVTIITTLFHASLPEAYLGRRGVQVLDATGELFLNWTRRVQETGQFLVNVMSPTPDLWRDEKTSLTSGEFGARAARRVRLTHAAIRWMLDAPVDVDYPSIPLVNVPDLTEWKARLINAGLEDSTGDRPLNQQDLVATLGTFTTVVLKALERLGVPYDEEDRAAIHFLWNVVGWHLGIGDRATLAEGPLEPRTGAWEGNALLPMAADEMDRTYRHLAQQLQGPSDAGRRMAKALMQELAFPLPRPLQGAPSFIARYLIGPDHANMLEIEEGGFVELFIGKSRLLEYWTTRARAGPVGRFSVGLLSRSVTSYAIRAFITQARWSERGLTIDPRIAAKWGIQIPPEPRTPPRA